MLDQIVSLQSRQALRVENQVFLDLLADDLRQH
jgi:hypothetical protein